MAKSYIAICAQIVGGGDLPFEIVYGWDGKEFATRKLAILHGFKIRASDDFNIGVLENGRLVEFGWMDQPMHASDSEELSAIERSIGILQ